MMYRVMSWIERHKKSLFAFLGVLLVAGAALTLIVPNAFADVGHSVSRSRSSSSSSSSSGSSGGGSISDIAWLVYLAFKHPILFIIVVIIYVIYSKIKKSVNGDSSINAPAINPIYENEGFRIPQQSNIEKIKEHDPNFSSPNFVMKVNNMYMQLQGAWTRKEWKSIRPFETDELFNQHAMQLQKYIDSKQTNVVDNICILSTNIINYEDDGYNDIIDVMIKARFNDYEKDDVTGKVLVGDPNEEIYMTYVWKMIRKKGVTTDIGKGTKADSCPNCGAPMSINQSGVCEYCGSAVTSGEYDWVLTSIRTIEQR